jgi:hypothetical protein
MGLSRTEDSGVSTAFPGIPLFLSAMCWTRVILEQVVALVPWSEKLFSAAVLQPERGMRLEVGG